MEKARPAPPPPLPSFEQFYSQLRDKENPTILSCLRAIRESSSSKASTIETLARLVQEGKVSKNPGHQETAIKIANIIVRSHFFTDVEREVRDIFLTASSESWLYARITEWARMAYNRLVYGPKTERAQTALINFATQTILEAIEDASRPENIPALFEQKFESSLKNVKRAEIFKNAFLTELQADLVTCREWWLESVHTKWIEKRQRAEIELKYAVQALKKTQGELLTAQLELENARELLKDVRKQSHTPATREEGAFIKSLSTNVQDTAARVEEAKKHMLESQQRAEGLASPEPIQLDIPRAVVRRVVVTKDRTLPSLAPQEDRERTEEEKSEEEAQKIVEENSPADAKGSAMTIYMLLQAEPDGDLHEEFDKLTPPELKYLVRYALAALRFPETRNFQAAGRILTEYKTRVLRLLRGYDYPAFARKELVELLDECHVQSAEEKQRLDALYAIIGLSRETA